MQAVGRDQVVAGRQHTAVDDEQEVAVGGTLVGTEARTLGQVRREQRGEVGEVGGHHPPRSDRVGVLCRQGMRAAT